MFFINISTMNIFKNVVKLIICAFVIVGLAACGSGGDSGGGGGTSNTDTQTPPDPPRLRVTSATATITDNEIEPSGGIYTNDTWCTADAGSLSIVGSGENISGITTKAPDHEDCQ